jgi:hypothetical protein
MRSLMFILLAKLYSADKIKKNEVDGACSTYWKKERCDRVLVVKPEEKEANWKNQT